MPHETSGVEIVNFQSSNFAKYTVLHILEWAKKTVENTLLSLSDPFYPRAMNPSFSASGRYRQIFCVAV